MSTILSIISTIIIRKVIIGIVIASIKTTMFSHFQQRKTHLLPKKNYFRFFELSSRHSSTGANVLKLFTAVVTNFRNKLERFSLASFFSLVQCLCIRSYLKGASLGQAPALRANIRQGWKGLPGTNTLAYYDNLQIRAVKCFITLTPGYRNKISQS